MVKIDSYFTKNNPGVMSSQCSTVSPQTRMSTHEMVIMVMPNLKASVWLYWFVLYNKAAGLLLKGNT